MGAVAALALTLLAMASAVACGGISASILSRTGADRLTGFGWGATLGPIGIAVALLAAHRRQRAAAVASVDLPCT